MQPNYTSRRSYCGEPEPEAWLSCCGERHFEQVPECPLCGDDIDTARHSVTGIEACVHSCRSCDWQSDPE